MLIVAGWLEVDPSARDGYVADCVEAVRQARESPGCLAYAVTADPLDSSRILVYERWESEPDLLAFRGSGPSQEQTAAIRAAEVARYEISGVGPA